MENHILLEQDLESEHNLLTYLLTKTISILNFYFNLNELYLQTNFFEN